jgi:hypothetical protein
MELIARNGIALAGVLVQLLPKPISIAVQDGTVQTGMDKVVIPGIVLLGIRE